MKKSNKILMILGIITCLTIIGTCIYFVYNVATNEKNDITESNKNNDVNEQVKETNTDTKEQELEVTEEDRIIANNLLKPFDKYKVCLAYDKLGYIYKYDKLISENLPNDIILDVSLYKYVTQENPFSNLEYGGTGSVTVSSTKIKNYVNGIFGENFTYKNDDIPPTCLNGVEGLYDSNNDVYVFSRPENGCGGAVLPYIDSKIIQVKKYNDRMEIIEKIAYIEYEIIDSTIYKLIYNNPKDMKLIEKKLDSSEDIFEKYLSELTSYKWTFKKDEDNYYFDKIEKLN